MTDGCCVPPEPPAPGHMTVSNHNYTDGTINDAVQADILPSPIPIFPPQPQPIQTGVVLTRPRCSCLVITEGWPAWMFVVGALNFHCSRWYRQQLGALTVPIPPIPPVLHSDSLPVLDQYLFISGTTSFVAPFWTAYSTSNVLLIALDQGFSPLPQWQTSGSWFLLHHKDFDGVTSGAWWCGISKVVDAAPTPIRSQRRLRHILDHTISRGVADPPPPAPMAGYDHPVFVSQICHPGGLWPLDQPQALCFSPSIFTKGWISRPLSAYEIDRCLDVPLSIQTPRENSLSLLTAAPPKILMALGKLGISISQAQVPDGQIFGLKAQDSFTPKHPRFQYECSLTPVTEEVTEVGRVSASVSTIQHTPVKGLQLGGVGKDSGLEGSAMHSHAEIQEVFTSIQTPEPELQMVESSEYLGRERSAKNDDAEIPIHLWDDPFWEELPHLNRDQCEFVVVRQQRARSTDGLRKWLLRVWRRSVFLSFCKYMRHTYGDTWVGLNNEDMAAGRDCLQRTASADFWEWHGGSRLYFWRWPMESRAWARDGHPVLMSGRPVTYKRPQSHEPNPVIRDKVKEKLSKFLNKGYLAKGKVTSLVSYFTVPKGDSDVRIVFDGTKSGLNSVIYAPHFQPTHCRYSAPKIGSWFMASRHRHKGAVLQLPA
jgi:hypothetical protein